MSNPRKNIPRVVVEECMTCPLCEKLLVNATTIMDCLHTFCKSCIYEKFSDDERDSCPVCNVDLGCNPLDKLRPDHNMEDIKAKLYPLKRQRRTHKAPEAAPSVSAPPKRKKKSLSSLVVSAPRVPARAGVTGRRTRSANRKSSAPRRSSPHTDEPHRKNEGSDDGHMEGPSSPETLAKIMQNTKLASSSDHNLNEGASNSNGDGKVDVWKPLNCLVEAANRTKFSKSNSAGTSHARTDPSFSQGAGADEDGLEGDQDGIRTEETQDDPNANGSASATLLSRRRRLRQPNRNAADVSGDIPNSSQLAVDVMRLHRQNVPIWFSLVASEVQEGDVPLPQISSGYLRMKNGDMPVAFIQKYIAKKLELPNANEVQIMCQGKGVFPSLKLRELLDMWLREAPGSRRIKTSVGSSAEEYVMVLSYSLKAQAQAEPQAQAQLHQPLGSNNN